MVVLTEEEWLACDNILRMLSFLGSKQSPRKYRAFVLACCDRTLPDVTDPRSIGVVAALERYDEEPRKRASRENLAAAAAEARRAVEEAPEGSRARALAGVFLMACAQSVGPGLCAGWVVSSRVDAARISDPAAGYRAPKGARQLELAALAHLLRDIVGVPHRPSSLIEPAWLNANGGLVPTLCTTIHQERAFSQLPILADALEDAGCANEEILGHLRDPGPHVRGCWAVDLVLSKR
jgi:hypothetical protein